MATTQTALAAQAARVAGLVLVRYPQSPVTKHRCWRLFWNGPPLIVHLCRLQHYSKIASRRYVQDAAYCQ
eukprot:COSAG02_NODE_1558_length_11928_cov_4.044974_1_plen_69_part_10